MAEAKTHVDQNVKNCASMVIFPCVDTVRALVIVVLRLYHAIKAELTTRHFYGKRINKFAYYVLAVCASRLWTTAFGAVCYSTVYSAILSIE